MKHEQKYKNALEKARELLSCCIDDRDRRTKIYRVEDIESIFPELKENESDKIRKELKHYLEVRRCQTNDDEEYINCNHFIDWLEKLGGKSQCKTELKENSVGIHILVRPEDEKNEKVRIGLIKAFNTIGKLKWGGLNVQDVLTWLEKQGERANFLSKIQVGDEVTRNEDGELVNLSQLDRVAKPADKVEPKFHPGDWVIDNFGHIYQIATATEIVSEHIFGYTIVGGGYFNDNSDARLWTIEDAKDGDVLISSNKHPFVYNGNYTSNSLGAYFGLVYNNELLICDSHGNNWTGLTGVRPATEEQRNMLFKKLQDSDYKWDADKKKVKKTEHKSVWSENDEHRAEDIVYFLDIAKKRCKKQYASTIELDNCIDWIKSLKDRIKRG